MIRRIRAVILLMVLGTGTVWCKFKEEEQKFLDDQFRATQEQIQALKAQVAALSSQLDELRQNQSQLQAVIIRQQRAMQEMEQTLSAMRLTEEENFSGLKAALSRLEAQQQKGLSTLTGQSTQPAGLGPEAARPAKTTAGTSATPGPVQGYVVEVKGDEVTVDIGTERGINAGTRLTVFKANDPNTRVGVLEIIQPAAGSSRARAVTLNPGIQLDFSDIVRLE
jgi:hypothetical protein